MKAMVLKKLCSLKENQTPLELMELPVPVPGEQEILLRVSACAVCHTELDEIEDERRHRTYRLCRGIK